MITENLSTLKIHKLTQAQYERELKEGRIDPNAIYLTPDDSDEEYNKLISRIDTLNNKINTKVDKVVGYGLAAISEDNTGITLSTVGDDGNLDGIVNIPKVLSGYIDDVGYATNEKVDDTNEKINEIYDILTYTAPALTEVSPDGTILGSDGWTGTGFVSLENNVRVDYKRYQVSKYTNSDGSISNKYSPFTQVHGFQRFCLRFADPSGNKWKNWTPWIDIDGVAYEFFYSPTRKLYEALIPATDKLAEEIVSEIRWERAEPDVIRYGKVSQCCAVGSADNGTTPVYSFFTDEASLRDNSGAYCTLDKNILGEIVNGNISAPIVDNINLLAKLHLQIDVSSSGSLSSATHLISVSQLIVGTITELPIDTIDNFA